MSWDFKNQDWTGLFFDPPLLPQHTAYLRKFSQTRRVRRDSEQAKFLPDADREQAALPLGEDAEFFVGGLGFAGQQSDLSVVSNNVPPARQPGLWCGWIPNEEGTRLEFNFDIETAKDLDEAILWLSYLDNHFFNRWDYDLKGACEIYEPDEKDTVFLLLYKREVLIEDKEECFEFFKLHPQHYPYSKEKSPQLDWIDELNLSPSTRRMRW